MKLKGKLNPIWESSCFYQQELTKIWAENHDRDVPETNFNWQSWQKKEQSSMEMEIKK